MEEYMSIKDYAAKCGKSYEAVRKKVSRYEKELEGHTFRDKRRIYLDEYAMDFLNEHSYPDQVQVVDSSEDLQEENKRLTAKLLEVYEQKDKLNEEIATMNKLLNALKDEKHNYILQLAELDHIVVHVDVLEEQLKQKEADLQKLKEENTTLCESLEEYKNRKWWQFWK